MRSANACLTAAQDTVEVPNVDVQTAFVQTHHHWMKAKGKQCRSANVALLDASGRINAETIANQEVRMSITGCGVMIKSWALGFHLFQQNVPQGEPNAFLRFSCRLEGDPFPLLLVASNSRTLLATVSAELGTATPTCSGQSCTLSVSSTLPNKVLAVSRRRVSPTAIGRMPPAGFGTPTNRAAVITFMHSAEKPPLAKREQNAELQ